MVAIRDDEHDHDGDPVCPGCRFKAALAEELTWAADAGGAAWYVTTGEVIELMGTASVALARLRNTKFDNEKGDPEEHAREAAAAISRLGGAIEELWHAVMEDDADGDPSAAL